MKRRKHPEEQLVGRLTPEQLAVIVSLDIEAEFMEFVCRSCDVPAEAQAKIDQWVRDAEKEFAS